jgi:hypothetical protein
MPSMAVIALLLTQPAASEQAATGCKFAYTDDVRQHLVTPELVRRLGSLSKNYEVEGVVIHRREGGVVDLLIPPNEEFGVSHLDPPYFEIRLIDCGGKLYGSRWTYWPGTGVTGAWVTPDQPWPKPAR